MYCKKCGTKIPEGNRFCEECGTPVAIVKKEGADTRSETPSTGIAKNMLQGKMLIAVIAAIVILFAGIGTVAATVTHHKNADYTDKLASAQKYLDDGDYESAIETFDKAIDIRPKRTEAYLAKADAQIMAGDEQGAIKTLETASEIVKDKQTIDDRLTEIRNGKDSRSSREAYREILLKHQDSIEAYEYPEYGESRPSTALCDINGDGIQELFFMMAPDSYGDAELYVFSYLKGKVVELEITYPNGRWSDESEEGRFKYVNAASGTTYSIYKTTDDHLVICSTIADESSEKIICDYIIDEKLNISRDHWVEEMTVNWNDKGEFVGEDYKYYHKTDPLDREKFDKKEQQLADGMEQVILTNAEDDLNDTILRKTIKQTPISEFCADMIQDLAVEETPTKSTAKKSDYDQVLEEYKNVFKLTKSGDYDYDDDANWKYVPDTFAQGVAEYIRNSDGGDLYLKYAEKDLNGNGKKELIVGCTDEGFDEPVIDSVFAIGKDGKVRRIISCDSYLYRATLDIYNDGVIEYFGSSSAVISNYLFYAVNKDGDDITTVDSFSTDSDGDDYETILYDHNGKKISEDEFNSLLEKRHEKPRIKLDWIGIKIT